MIKLVNFLLFFTLLSNAQNKLLDILPLRNGKVMYSNILEVKNLTRDSLYLRAKKWFLDNKGKVEEISINNTKYREITGKISFKILWGPNDYNKYYVTISPTFHFKIRNERYQYEISDFIILQSGLRAEIEVYQITNNKYTKFNKLFYQKIDQQINNYIASFEMALQH